MNRTDKAGITKKITEVRKLLLEHYCKLNKWALIKHSNIESNHLNSYRLHLNRSGTAMLGKNITSFLNNKSDSETETVEELESKIQTKNHYNYADLN